ncbi:MAG: hypothetical protein HY609_04825, partial [Deltaproteobacteria bacterium]|nr:hypothetical protein [Deltaproteobacteria bacterium]
GQAWPDPSRMGIVHRLDRDTSGVMVLAKTPEILANLQEQFHNRTVEKQYLALVVGAPSWKEQTVQAPISRSEGTRRKAAFLKLPNEPAKDAETFLKVLKNFRLRTTDYGLRTDFLQQIEKPVRGPRSVDRGPKKHFNYEGLAANPPAPAKVVGN